MGGLFDNLLKNGELPKVRVELTEESIVKLFAGLMISGLVLIIGYAVAKKI